MQKEVDKALNPQESPKSKGTEAVEKEFGVKPEQKEEAKPIVTKPPVEPAI